MHVNESHTSGLRRLTVLLAALALALACATLLGAQPAAAACPINDLDCTPGGDGTTATITHTLTVTKSEGTVTSNPVGINCGTDCTERDSQTVSCTPEGECNPPNPAGWGSYTLTASGGRAGLSPVWTGCDSVATGACQVTLDASRTVNLGWADLTDPVVNTLSVTNAVGGKVGPLAQVSATASDTAGVSRVEWFLGTSTFPVVADTAAPFTGTINLSSVADGSQVTIRARAVDTSNRIGAEKTVTVTVDKHVGILIGGVPAFTSASTVPLTISTDADASMKCALSGAQSVAAAPCGPGAYSPIGPSSPDGTYAYTVTATDGVGNTASATRSFVLDRTLPALAFTEGPSEGQLVGTPTLGFAFSEAEANPQALVCRLDGSVIACSPGAAVTLVGLTNGSHAFSVHATDKAGNERTITRHFAVSLPGPGGGGGGGGGSATVQPTVATGSTPTAQLVVSLKAPPQRALRKKKLVLRFTSNQRFKVAATVRLHGKVIAKFSKRVRSGKSTVKVELGRKALARLRKALRKRRTTKLVLKLTYTGTTAAKAHGSKRVTIRR